MLAAMATTKVVARLPVSPLAWIGPHSMTFSRLKGWPFYLQTVVLHFA